MTTELLLPSRESQTLFLDSHDSHSPPMAHTAADPDLYGPQPAAPPPLPQDHRHYDPSAAAPPYHHPHPHHHYAYYSNPSPVVPHENPSPPTAAEPGGYAYPHYSYPPPEAYAGYPPPPTPAYSDPPPEAYAGYPPPPTPAYSYPPPGATEAPPGATEAPPAPYYYGPPGGLEGPPGVHPPSYPLPMMMGTGQKKTSEDLETKKQKLIKGGTAADAVRICSPCNIVCNSDVTFAAHLGGEKHAQKMSGIYMSSNDYTVDADELVQIGKTFKEMMMGTGQKKTSEDLETKKRKLIKGGTAADAVRICSPCNIVCNSDVTFAAHLGGEKHAQKMLMGTGQMKTSEDMETKKRKMFDAGTAADAVKVCTVCNIVCNSQSVFISHLVGHKHVSMVKQQQQSKPAN